MEKITYGYYSSPIGELIIGETNRGLCWVGFMVDGYKGNGDSRMRNHFKTAECIEDSNAVKDTAAHILERWRAGEVFDGPLDLHGTPFQRSVWQALQSIPAGKVVSYGQIANDIGKPKAARAVGTAVGDNPVSLVIPCHRVINRSGALGNYGWGIDLKRKLLQAEGAQIENIQQRRFR